MYARTHDKESFDLGKNKEHEQLEAVEEFAERGLIEGVLGVVKSGKEATVYLCDAPDASNGLLAAKVYRSRDVRRFGDDAVYTEGRTRGMRGRDARAVLQKSRAGREIAFGKWVSAEYETLRALHEGGCDVPAPVDRTDTAVLMEYIGDDDGPAPALANVRLSADEARRVWSAVLRNIEMLLACDRVHGDLSAFNILYWRDTPVVIDFPQAVDARFNQSALSLLERDIDRVAAHFARMGVQVDGWRIARDLWGRFIRSEL
jgi:RIO kinase 1